ncbi:MAG TPA: hypothetical protein PLP63_06320 [Saprospiraceae bacterium]|nr:hypothetical protein [Saprospiraceae bacterium]
MAVYPELYKVERGQIDSPDYAGEYKIPLIDKEDYDELLKASHKVREDRVAKSENLFKELNNMKLQPKAMFSSPDLQVEAMNLQKLHGIDDANVSAAMNGGPYMMRRLEANYYNYANDAKYADLVRQETAFQQFKKEADKIKDPNFRKQAYASINAFMSGEPDPITGKKISAYDLNIGDFAAMDLEKDISNGLEPLKTTTNVTEERDGYIQTYPKTSIDSKKAQEFIDVYTSNPAVQRNLAARGLGLVNGENGKFELNENGMTWIKNIVDSKSQPTQGKAGIRFNTKTYNDHLKNVDTGLVTDDIAKGSGKVSETLTKEGDQNVRREKTVFDEQLFRDSVALKLKDPAFRKQMIDQGLMKEDGTYTEEFDKAISVYKRKGEGEKIKQYKNAPKATTSGRSGGSNGMANIKSAFDEEGLEFIKVGGVDLSKKVNYRVIKSSSSGKYYLRVGSTSDNDIPLKEGVNFRRKGASSQGQVGPEPYTPPPAKKEATKSKSGKTEPPKKKKVTAADL